MVSDGQDIATTFPGTSDKYRFTMTDPDGCDLDFRDNPTDDKDIDGIVLFAGTDPEDADAVDDLAEAWRRLREATDAP